jgi:hypothetical protein
VSLEINAIADLLENPEVAPSMMAACCGWHDWSGRWSRPGGASLRSEPSGAGPAAMLAPALTMLKPGATTRLRNG